MKQKLIDNFSLEGEGPKPIGWILYGPYKYVSWIETRFCETLNYSNLLLLILQLILIYLFKMDGYTAFIYKGKISISARVLAIYETTLFPISMSRHRVYLVCTLVYRWKILRSTNPGTPKTSNCFELPSDWLLSYCKSQWEGSSKQLLYVYRAGLWGSRICTSKT